MEQGPQFSIRTNQGGGTGRPKKDGKAIFELKDHPRNFFEFNAEKLSSSNWTPKWQSRFFALTRVGTLEYYRNRIALKDGKLRLSIFVGDIVYATVEQHPPYVVLSLTFASKQKAFKIRSRDFAGIKNLRQFMMRLKSQLHITSHPLRSVFEDSETSSKDYFMKHGAGSRIHKRGGARGEDSAAIRLAFHVGNQCVDTLELKLRPTTTVLSASKVLRNARPVVIALPPSSSLSSREEGFELTIEASGYINAKGMFSPFALFGLLNSDNKDNNNNNKNSHEQPPAPAPPSGEVQLELRSQKRRGMVCRVFLRYWQMPSSSSSSSSAAAATATAPFSSEAAVRTNNGFTLTSRLPLYEDGDYDSGGVGAASSMVGATRAWSSHSTRASTPHREYGRCYDTHDTDEYSEQRETVYSNPLQLPPRVRAWSSSNGDGGGSSSSSCSTRSKVTYRHQQQRSKSNDSIHRLHSRYRHPHHQQQQQHPTQEEGGGLHRSSSSSSSSSSSGSSGCLHGVAAAAAGRSEMIACVSVAIAAIVGEHSWPVFLLLVAGFTCILIGATLRARRSVGDHSSSSLLPSASSASSSSYNPTTSALTTGASPKTPSPPFFSLFSSSPSIHKRNHSPHSAGSAPSSPSSSSSALPSRRHASPTTMMMNTTRTTASAASTNRSAISRTITTTTTTPSSSQYDGKSNSVASSSGGGTILFFNGNQNQTHDSSQQQQQWEGEDDTATTTTTTTNNNNTTTTTNRTMIVMRLVEFQLHNRDMTNNDNATSSSSASEPCRAETKLLYRSRENGRELVEHGYSRVDDTPTRRRHTNSINNNEGGEKEEAEDGEFPPQLCPIWCIALSCAELSKLRFSPRMRSLVLDYWFGALQPFTHYDADLNVTVGKERELLLEFKKKVRSALHDVETKRKEKKGGHDAHKDGERKSQAKNDFKEEQKKDDQNTPWLRHLNGSLHECCRFMMARGFNLQKATKLLHQAIELREKHNLDSVIFTTMERYPRFKELYPLYHQGYDDKGWLTMIRPLGLVQTAKTLENFTLEDIMNLEIMFNEIMQRILSPAASRVFGKIEWRAHPLIDMKDVGVYTLLDHKLKQIFTASSAIVQVCYPENLGVASVVRAPRMFSMLWAVLKKVLTKRTQAKIEVDSSSDPSNVLLPFFTKTKCLPTQYGGTDTNKGPHYIDSEVEMLVHTYFSGQRDIRELIPDNSEYSFIPLLST